MKEQPAPLTEEQLATWSKLQFYLKDGEIEDALDDWSEWIDYNVKGNYRLGVGSSSWATGKRFVTFLFENQEDAVLFRLFLGGTVVEP